MSLVALKNIFFYKTITPKAPISNREPGVPNIDFTASRQPLLSPSNGNNSGSESIGRNHDDDESTLDLESQDSRSEKSSHKKGWRVDARPGYQLWEIRERSFWEDLRSWLRGAISMGLGGYLGANSELASYRAIREETIERISTDLPGVMSDLMEVFEPYNLPKHTLDDLATSLAQSPRLVDFVMQFQHCQEEPATSRAFTSAITISLGYFLGGLLPLLPYFS
ncbi:hypothetical protein DID88_006658 [Monilinia fructigena]|uniref:Uncharacterized protein n=1 Tax=Monilinia fructigena TaxID=38457 RepID=A0A395IIN0_9HELO|nr:hypothetical protein DID88_006658 [Monilinia fructigena]